MKIERPFRTGCMLVLGAGVGLVLFVVLLALIPAALGAL